MPDIRDKNDLMRADQKSIKFLKSYKNLKYKFDSFF